MSDPFTDRTVIMSGGSRGIGLAIALAAARRGANVALMAKTDRADPRLPGTVHSAAEQIEAAGGKALAIVGDVRNADDVEWAVHAAASRFGGIDIVINNASALNMAGTQEISVKRYDLMQEVNSRGTFLLTRAAVPHLLQSDRARILTLSPPINLAPHWMGKFPPYMLSKYGMTLLTLAWAAEFAGDGIAANCLWPQTTIATAAVVNLLGGDEAADRARSPEIMADAAIAVLELPAERSGETLIDVDVLAEHGQTDLARYGGGSKLDWDFFLDIV